MMCLSLLFRSKTLERPSFQNIGDGSYFEASHEQAVAAIKTFLAAGVYNRKV